MRSPRIQVYRDEQHQYRWRFLSNGRIIADSGQGYTHRVDALNGLEQTTGGKVYLPTPPDELGFNPLVNDASEPPESERPVLLRPTHGGIVIRSARIPIEILGDPK